MQINTMFRVTFNQLRSIKLKINLFTRIKYIFKI